MISKSTIIGPGNKYHVKPFSHYQNSYAETLTKVVRKEAANLYEKMVKDFTNEAMTYAAAACPKMRIP